MAYKERYSGANCALLWLFDSHSHSYNLPNSQRYTLKAEDAAEFGGSESARLYYFNSIIIAGLEVLCQTTTDAARRIRRSEFGAIGKSGTAVAVITPPHALTGAESSGRIRKARRPCTNISDYC